ncbi:uncharacterized protein LOC117344238 [Pecten maximus]|uniref:uncharacterized protein LOC117344238 n=1 Tax=Pecten maximus TaxID=6579 RepID=UPI001457F510|nr:uncharacterized protein LOC117344238 [Pecten maximus]
MVCTFVSVYSPFRKCLYSSLYCFCFRFPVRRINYIRKNLRLIQTFTKRTVHRNESTNHSRVYNLTGVDGLPVYKVQREDGVGVVRTLHRNMLLLFTAIPTDLQQSDAGDNRRVCPNKVSRVKTRVESSSSSEETDGSSTDSGRYVIPQRRTSKRVVTLGAPGPVRSSTLSQPLSPSLHELSSRDGDPDIARPFHPKRPETAYSPQK